MEEANTDWKQVVVTLFSGEEIYADVPSNFFDKFTFTDLWMLIHPMAGDSYLLNLTNVSKIEWYIDEETDEMENK